MAPPRDELASCSDATTFFLLKKSPARNGPGVRLLGTDERLPETEVTPALVGHALGFAERAVAADAHAIPGTLAFADFLDVRRVAVRFELGHERIGLALLARREDLHGVAARGAGGLLFLGELFRLLLLLGFCFLGGRGLLGLCR